MRLYIKSTSIRLYIKSTGCTSSSETFYKLKWKIYKLIEEHRIHLLSCTSSCHFCLYGCENPGLVRIIYMNLFKKVKKKTEFIYVILLHAHPTNRLR